MFLRQAFAHIASTTLMTALVGAAYYKTLRQKHEDESADLLSADVSPDVHPKSSVEVYAEKYGFRHERHTTTTSDGFILVFDRIYSPNAVNGTTSISHGDSLMR